jgi:hypothetical protein
VALPELSINRAACLGPGFLATKYLTNIQFFPGFKSCKLLIPNKTSKLLLWKLAYATLHRLDDGMPHLKYP